MARPRKTENGLTRPVSFRLSSEDYAAYQEKVTESGLNQSEFFRQCVLTNKTHVVAKPKVSADQRRLIYLFNKTSNNINQLAHRANADHLSGKLTENTYQDILNQLEVVARYMKAVLGHVD